jgi:Rrf2 family protein
LIDENGAMRISAKAEYSVLAAVSLAAAGEGPIKSEVIAEEQEIPARFLENILSDMRRAGIIASQRGSDGGYWLARPADEITLAEVIRAVDGPLATVRGIRPEATSYDGVAMPLRDVWLALRAHIRVVLERVTLADVVSGKLPKDIVSASAEAPR